MARAMNATVRRIVGDAGRSTTDAKAYIVTSGSYSEYHIEAVFSTAELAEEYVARVNGPDEWSDRRVEEWDMDEPREAWPGCWKVGIDETGKVLYAWWSDEGCSCDPAVSSMGFFVGWGPTMEHARRSAEQLRRETLALPFLHPDEALPPIPEDAIE